jgi:hypothetical protein
MTVMDVILTFIDFLLLWRISLTFIIGLLACALLISFSPLSVLNVLLCILIMTASVFLGIYWQTKPRVKNNVSDPV